MRVRSFFFSTAFNMGWNNFRKGKRFGHRTSFSLADIMSRAHSILGSLAPVATLQLIRLSVFGGVRKWGGGEKSHAKSPRIRKLERESCFCCCCFLFFCFCFLDLDKESNSDLVACATLDPAYLLKTGGGLAHRSTM